MVIKERTEGAVVIFELSGTLHSETDAMLLRAKMYSCVDKHGTRIVLDLADLHYINSWGLGLLVAILSMVRKAGGDLRLARLGEHVHNLFIVTQLSKVFETY